MTEERNYRSFEYYPDVKRYVDGSIDVALAADIDGDPALERTNHLLFDKIANDNVLRNQIVERITIYGIRFTIMYYKTTEPDERIKRNYMNRLREFLHPRHLTLLADLFDRQIEEAKSQKHSR